MSLLGDAAPSPALAPAPFPAAVLAAALALSLVSALAVAPALALAPRPPSNQNGFQHTMMISGGVPEVCLVVMRVVCKKRKILCHKVLRVNPAPRQFPKPPLKQVGEYPGFGVPYFNTFGLIQPL